jgi:hypothetical protein
VTEVVGEGDVDLAKQSEHGLGHLLNPLDPEDPSHDWIEEAWGYLLFRALGLEGSPPKWLDRPALTRVSASSPTVLRWFASLNEDKAYTEQIKPANFLLLAHPDPLDPSGALPIAPYESDASRWVGLPWVDRRTGQPVRITTEPSDGHERTSVVRVRTYGGVLADYLAHPEAKSLCPDDGPVSRRSTGLLHRRPVAGLPVRLHVGKEGNRLEDRVTGLALGPDEFRTEYVDPTRTIWSELVVPVLRTMNRTTVSRALGAHRRTIERWLYKGVRPHPNHERAMTTLAVEHAAARLDSTMNLRLTSATLQAYLDRSAGPADM